MKKEEYLSLIDEVIAQGPYTDTWDSLCEHPTPKWYARDKFGIFIHWGVYSVPAFGNEWYPRNMYVKGSKENLHHTEKYGTLDKFGYKDFIPQFKAEKFDPKEWAELFKEAGAKFVVPVAEHHDGFQMYASDLCRWNAAEMGPKRDILGELKTEVEKEVQSVPEAKVSQVRMPEIEKVEEPLVKVEAVNKELPKVQESE